MFTTLCTNLHPLPPVAVLFPRSSIYHYEVVAQTQNQITKLQNERRSKEYRIHLTHYLPVDFVMRAAVTSNFLHKLSANWVGPYRVMVGFMKFKTCSRMLLQHAITARLQFYHDASLNVTVELEDHVTHSRGNVTYYNF